MSIFGAQSLIHRATLHGDLILVADAAIQEQDFAIICGLRNERDQWLAFNSDRSKAKPPQSYHNGSLDEHCNLDKTKSDAMDIIPHPVEWPDKDNDSPYEYVRKMARFYNLAELILKKADELGIVLEWGGMFKGFFDGVHFQRSR